MRAELPLWRVWVGATRPRTLPAAIAPVILATALAGRDDTLVAPAAAACLAFALLVQVATNFANDYFDFVKGADTAERVGPARAVASGRVRPATMRTVTGVVLLAAFAVGLSLLNYGGWPLLVIGVASLVCAVAYTGGPYPLAYHGWGDVFVFGFFGLVAVGATYYVQAGTVTLEAWLLGAGVGALATNILITNNYRDVETDARAGKRTTVVRFGRGFARAQFLTGHAVALLAVAGLAVRGVVAWELAGAILVWGVWEARRQFRVLRRRSTTAAELIALLGRTGRQVAVYAGLLAAAMVWSLG